MKRILSILVSLFLLFVFSTCEKFEVNPLTKVETITATPQLTAVTVSGKIIELSGAGNDDYGFCYALHSEPSVEDGKVSTGKPKVGNYEGLIEGVDMGAQLYVRAYCQDGDEYIYGEVKSVVLPNITVATVEVTGVLHYVATSGGSVTVTGEATVNQRGICWSTSPNPTVGTPKSEIPNNANGLSDQDNKSQQGSIERRSIAEGYESGMLKGQITSDGFTTDGSGAGAFESQLTGLQSATKYYVRAYAQAGSITVYGNEVSFTTLAPVLATVTTGSVSNISVFTSSCSGEVTYDGGSVVTTKGVCWSTTPNPTLANSHSEETGGVGSFTSQLIGLSPNVSYYVRAYAVNSVGTAYGEQLFFTTQNGIVQLSTSEPTSITSTGAVSGGYISTDGGSPVTARGVVWGTASLPTTTINTGSTSNSSGQGGFTSILSNLTPSTTYYVRAYAINAVSTYYGEEKTFSTTDGLPILTTAEVTQVTATTALCGGNVTSDGGFAVTVRGVVWSITENPTVAQNEGLTENGTGTGTYLSYLTNLTPDVTYYLRAYATNSIGTRYGEEKTFTTSNGLPVLTTTAVSQVTATTAVCGGNITSDGGFAVTARGVVWSTSQNPTTTSNQGITSNGTGTGSYTSNLTGLTLNTIYYVRAYSTNSVGTYYGNQQTFTTLDGVITLNTTAATSITATTATSGGSITSDGGFAVTARGVVWSTSQSPTTTSNQGITSNGTGTGTYTSNLTGLTLNTTYYVRAYSTNNVGTYYGNQQTFTTLDGVITLNTTAATSITATTATSGGSITSDGGFAVTARGVVWSTSENPTVEENEGISENGSDIGSFISNITGLTPSVKYYVRAYALNSIGAGYGEQKTFTTQDGLPVLSTAAATNITATGATSGGTITSDGGFAVTARGVVWSTSQSPTTTSNQGITSNGSGTGSWVSELVDLQSGTVYYVRAYATNSEGTGYGNELTFTTSGTAVVDVTNPSTGKVWMDRNLGANRAATSSTDTEAYGDLYQWGRGSDGHEKRNSPTTSTLSSSDNPGHGSFILAPSSPNDWRSPQNTNLWQGVNGLNNPCPSGYRLPTDAELDAERASWSSNNYTGAFASPLKLPVAGSRGYGTGAISSLGSSGIYWSSAVDGTYSRYLFFSSINASVVSFHRASGMSVRCIKN